MKRPNARQAYQDSEGKADQQSDFLGVGAISNHYIVGIDGGFPGSVLFSLGGSTAFRQILHFLVSVLAGFVQHVGLLIAKDHHHDLNSAFGKKRHGQQPGD